MKISEAPYFGSIRAASEAIGCDARTLSSAINGNPVLSKTAKRICKALQLDPLDVDILDQGTDASPVGEEERVAAKSINIKADAVMEAEKTINSIFKSHEGVGSIQDIIDVLRVVIFGYAMKIARQNRAAGESHDAAFLFVDELAFHTKSMLYSELSGLDRIGEPDEPT